VHICAYVHWTVHKSSMCTGYVLEEIRFTIGDLQG
jgi:hypothetical protein